MDDNAETLLEFLKKGSTCWNARWMQLNQLFRGKIEIYFCSSRVTA